MEPPATTRSRVNNRSYIGRNEPTFVFHTDRSSSCFCQVPSASILDLDKISVVQKSRRRQRGGGRNRQIHILTKTLPLHRLILITDHDVRSGPFAASGKKSTQCKASCKAIRIRTNRECYIN